MEPETWERTYMAIDLKSFYASVECVERGLDPLTAKLVVADVSRTEKTICLAVTPALKAYGLSGRSRLFEVVQKAKQVKRETGKELEYIAAPPRMSLYMKYSRRIYEIYLKYFSPDDVHVYSVDEVFIDATGYLKLYKKSAYDLCKDVIMDVFRTTGITATGGIGPNLYLCKIAMDIVAKHIPGDENGVRIAMLDPITYRRTLWTHRPLTDFWRIGPGTAARLEKHGMYYLGDAARRSTTKEGVDMFFKEFGVDAELLLDHIWGNESCSMKSIKGYVSKSKSISSGQVLKGPYSFENARIIVWEMAELLALKLFEKNVVTSSISLYIGYDKCSVDIEEGNVGLDYYGRLVPLPVKGTVNLGSETCSTKIILEKIMQLFDSIVNPNLYVRRVNLCANNISSKDKMQLELFHEPACSQKEEALQNVRLNLMHKYGKNALLKGPNLQKSAMTIERNSQIGGHKA